MKPPTITNCRRNIMGTVDLDGLFPGMRKAADFIVYPMPEKTTTAHLQSEHRWAELNLETGRGLISEHVGNSCSLSLAMSVMRRTAKAFELSAEDLQTLRGFIRATGGPLVGNSVVMTDNTGALEA